MSDVHEGSLLILDDAPMTEATAEVIGKGWLAENPERVLPLAVAFRDVGGRARLVWIGSRPQNVPSVESQKTD